MSFRKPFIKPEQRDFTAEEIQGSLAQMRTELERSDERAKKAEAAVEELQKKLDERGGDAPKPTKAAEPDAGLRETVRLREELERSNERARKAEAAVEELQKKLEATAAKPEPESEVAALRAEVGRLAELVGGVMTDKGRMRQAMNQYAEAVKVVQGLDEQRKRDAAILREMRGSKIPE